MTNKHPLKRTPARSAKAAHPLSSRIRPMVVGNWKMELSHEQTVDLATKISQALPKESLANEVVICPSYPFLLPVAKTIQRTHLCLGAQNMWWDVQGHYTGEVSPAMLRSCGVQYVIIGHSERRRLLYEDDVMIAKKMISAVAHSLTPILCVGETSAQRAAGQQHAVIEEQLRSALRSLPPAHNQRSVVIAYEPIWAIGNGVHPTVDQAKDMLQLINAILDNLFPERPAGHVFRILYGGSANPDTVLDYVGPDRYHGALVGTASVQADSFVTIVQKVHHAFHT